MAREGRPCVGSEQLKNVKNQHMNLKWKQAGRLILAVPLLALSSQPGMAAEAQIIENSASSDYPRFGGPDSVTDQLEEDARQKDSLAELQLLPGYFAWKDCLREQHGLSFTVDYTAGIVGATETLGSEDYGSSGAVRFYGSWDLIGRESGNTGTFVWKVENRHRYSDIPASGIAKEIGYIGADFPSLSNIGTRLTNLYWKQNLNQGRLEIIAGFIDTTDWVDIYALASPWTGFSNFVFATGGASMPVPDDAALGAYVNAMITDHIYVSAGLADANADSTDPFNGFDTFFDDHEYFKTAEVGWTTSQDRFYLDNVHLTYWHVDERKDAGVSSGWGLNFSYAHAIGEKWTPFLRAGYAEDGGTLLQKTVSAGLGYHLKDDVSLLGFGVNWGEPNEDTFGSGLDDQYAIELFSRFQVTQNLQVTPDIQLIINPALNPGADQSWLFGVRGRLIF